MSIDALTCQIERLTIEVPELGQRSAKTRDMFAHEKAVAIQRLLASNSEFRPSAELVQRILKLVDSVGSVKSYDSLRGFRSQLVRSCNVEMEDEGSKSLVNQMISVASSFFSMRNIFGKSEPERWRVSENHLRWLGKDRFYDYVKKVPVTFLIIDRDDKPALVYTGPSLERLVADQVELSTLVEDVTIRLDTGNKIGMMGKGLFSLCNKQESVVQDEVNVSLQDFCDIVSKVTTGKFDAVQLPDVLLRVVFSHLPNTSFLHCRRVCRAWNSALGHPAAWENRIFTMNISSGAMPPHAIFFSPVFYNPGDEQWQNIRHRIKDIVCLARGGHIGAQIELAQRVLSKQGNYEIDIVTVLDWIKDIRTPKSLYVRGLSGESVELIRQSAKMGYAPAQNRMGIAYQDGTLVPQDLRKAEKWFLRAANQGYVYAESNLGGLYVDSNNDEALKWSLLAARKGHARAQYRIGVLLYERSKNIDEIKQACAWLERASDQNFVEAQYMLGKIFRDNKNLRNYKEAARYFQMAAQEQHAEAQYCLGLLYYNGQGVPKSASVAAKWYLLAAEQDVAMAQYRLAELYYEGDGVPENLEESFKWFLRAAELGVRDAQFQLARMYQAGTGVLASGDEAMKWLSRAADNGHVEACYLLGNTHWQGVEVPKNIDLAFKRLSFAAQKGHKEAQCCLGLMYTEGLGEKPDFEQAAKWFHLSAEQGCQNAQYILGYIYQHGIGVARNVKTAIKWYEFAALDKYGSDKEHRELEELIAQLRSLSK